MTDAAQPTVILTRSWWWGFALYGVVSLVHISALAIDSDALATPTKLLLMPLLALAVLWAARSGARGIRFSLLFTALALSLLGDGAATFFPFAPELPVMLACFGLAHLLYIWLFWRHLAVRRVPAWAAVYAVWYVVLLVILLPHLGALTVAVAIYGVVLGGTAVSATRAHPLVAVGAAFFLSSDTILALRLFLPDAMPPVTSPLVMVTYCLGQGLIAAGVIFSSTTRAER